MRMLKVGQEGEMGLTQGSLPSFSTCHSRIDWAFETTLLRLFKSQLTRKILNSSLGAGGGGLWVAESQDHHTQGSRDPL